MSPPKPKGQSQPLVKANKPRTTNTRQQKQPASVNALRAKAVEGRARSMLGVAEMMVAPGGAYSTRTPSYSAAPVSIATFTRTYTKSATAADQSFSLVVRPRISNFFWSSGTSALSSIHGFIFTGNYNEAGALASIIEVGANTPADDVYRAKKILRMQNSNVELSWTTTLTNAQLSFTVTNPSHTEAIIVQKTAVYTDTTTSAAVLVSLAPGQSTYSPITIPAGKTLAGVRMLAYYVGRITTLAPFEFNIADALATSVDVDDFTHPLIADRWIDASNSVSSYRVTGLSVLCSYRGNMLENAGVIAAARVDSEWIPTGVNMYESIMKLPYDKAKFPLMEGVYAWRLPYHLEELEFQIPGREQGPTTDLVVGGVFGDADAVLEITVNAIVEFYSPLQIFDRRPCPPMTDEFPLMIRELQSIPTVTCNPNHENLLKALEKGGKYFMKKFASGVTWAKENPQYVDLAIKALASLAL